MQQSCEVCKALGVPPLTSLMLKVRTVFQENVNVRGSGREDLACF